MTPTKTFSQCELRVRSVVTRNREGWCVVLHGVTTDDVVVETTLCDPIRPFRSLAAAYEAAFLLSSMIEENGVGLPVVIEKPQQRSRGT